VLVKIPRSLILFLLASVVLAAPAGAAPATGLGTIQLGKALDDDRDDATADRDRDKSGKDDDDSDDDDEQAGEDDEQTSGESGGADGSGGGSGTEGARGRAPDAGESSGAAGGPAAPAPKLGPDGPPVVGKRIAAAVASGEARVRLPGSDEYVALSETSTMPVGTLVDARAGAVALRTALPGGGTDRGTFGGGLFQVTQNARDGVTELRLRGGSYARCSARTFASAEPKPKVIRRLWGRDRGGRFRTHGHNSVATVRGTRWLTEDRCDGTLTRVTEGAVEVRDRRTGRRVLLHAGQSFLAKRV
jgi:hypothetical protein